MNSFKTAKVFDAVQKWRNFAKSGHTDDDDDDPPMPSRWEQNERHGSKHGGHILHLFSVLANTKSTF